MLDGIDNLVDEFQGHSRDYALGVGEGTLEGTERNTSFLSGYPREELGAGMHQ